MAGGVRSSGVDLVVNNLAEDPSCVDMGLNIVNDPL